MIAERTCERNLLPGGGEHTDDLAGPTDPVLSTRRLGIGLHLGHVVDHQVGDLGQLRLGSDLTGCDTTHRIEDLGGDAQGPDLRSRQHQIAQLAFIGQGDPTLLLHEEGVRALLGLRRADLCERRGACRTGADGLASVIVEVLRTRTALELLHQPRHRRVRRTRRDDLVDKRVRVGTQTGRGLVGLILIDGLTHGLPARCLGHRGLAQERRVLLQMPRLGLVLVVLAQAGQPRTSDLIVDEHAELTVSRADLRHRLRDHQTRTVGAVGTAVLDVSPARLGVREDRRIDPDDAGDLLTQRQHLLMLLDGDDPVLGPGVADPGLLVHVLVRLEHRIR